MLLLLTLRFLNKRNEHKNHSFKIRSEKPYSPKFELEIG